ncbi:MAG: hypothetical protein V3W41_13370 [Planctomycetota bacterium]
MNQLRLTLAALFLAALGSGLAFAQAPQCVPGYATTIVSFMPGTNQTPGDPANILGNTPNTFLNLGREGSIVLQFSDVFTTSGDALPDLHISEVGAMDCYYICLDPADAFTAAAVDAAGFGDGSTGGSFIELGQPICGTQNLDLDAFFPGFNLDDLHFNRIMILDANGAPNGAEIACVRAEFICGDSGNSTPQVCPPEFADTLVDVVIGGNHDNSSPTSALGDTPDDFYQLGDGGMLVVSFPNNYSNSGTNAPEFTIQEFGLSDCFFVLVSPADQDTADALTAAGLTSFAGFFDLGFTFCGTAGIDLDLFIPGNALGSLRFDNLMILDDNQGLPNGAEIVTINSLFPACPALDDNDGNDPVIIDPITCRDGFPTAVASVTPGSTSPVGNPNDLTISIPGTCFSPGVGGSITVLFEGPISTSGTTAADIEIDVTNSVPYFVGLKPADEMTGMALAAAGFSMVGEFYLLPGSPFIQDQAIDIDTSIPGFIVAQLLFSEVLLMDAGLNPAAGTCFTTVLAHFVCVVSMVDLEDVTWVNEVVAYNPDGTPADNDPNASLGLPDGDFVELGEGGCLEVRRNCQTFSNTGTPQPDIVIIEFGDVDDYIVAIRPANITTSLAIQSIGLMDSDGDGYFEIGEYQGETEIDLDTIIPSAPAGLLIFDAIQICDVPGAPNGSAEIDAVGFASVAPQSNDISSAGINATFFAFGTRTKEFGTGPIADTNGNNIFGPADGVPLTLGENGSTIVLDIGSYYTNSGDLQPDVIVFEVGDDEGYIISLCPADAATETIIAALYPDADANGCYEVGIFCLGDSAIDIDELIPGYGPCELIFSAIEITDDGMAPDTSSTGNTGADIDAVAFLFKKRPGSDGEDCLRLSYDLDDGEGFISHPSVFFLEANDPVSLKIDAPNGVCANQDVFLVTQCNVAGFSIAPPLGFPGIWVNPNRTDIQVPYGFPNIPPGGICIPTTAPAGLEGACCILQVIGLNASAPNGYYSSNALEVCF